MESYKINPSVDAVREFLEIAGDFTNPLEVVREAISNSMDASATEIRIEFSQPKEVGTYVLTILIEDNGKGMNDRELQSFFDLGNSAKRGNAAFIGEKGHGTKVYFNCAAIRVETVQAGICRIADMQQPYATLHDGKLPQVTVTVTATSDKQPGTTILIRGFNNNQGELFTQDKLRDYINWSTKFGSCEGIFGQQEHAKKVVYLKGLDLEADKSAEKIAFGHFFPPKVSQYSSSSTNT